MCVCAGRSLKGGTKKRRRRLNKFAHCHNLIMAAFIDGRRKREREREREREERMEV